MAAPPIAAPSLAPPVRTVRELDGALNSRGTQLPATQLKPPTGVGDVPILVVISYGGGNVVVCFGHVFVKGKTSCLCLRLRSPTQHLCPEGKESFTNMAYCCCKSWLFWLAVEI